MAFAFSEKGSRYDLAHVKTTAKKSGSGWTLDGEKVVVLGAPAAAKIKIADNARLISQEAIQLHGGMGMSEELKVSHSFRRLTMIAQQFGDADYHLGRFASL